MKRPSNRNKPKAKPPALPRPAPDRAKPDKRKKTLEALAGLAEREPLFRRAYDLCGMVADRRRPGDFANLCRIVVEQQISIAAANTIWGRLEMAVRPFDAAHLLTLDEAHLTACGLSRPKARYLRAIAEAERSGALNFALLPKLEDHAAMEMLVAVKGIGRWTAEIFLMFALDRIDIWPAHDVALQEAVRRLFGLRKRPDVKRMDRMAEKWRPYRGVAARLLWRYYGLTKGSSPVP